MENYNDSAFCCAWCGRQALNLHRSPVDDSDSVCSRCLCIFEDAESKHREEDSIDSLGLRGYIRSR